MRIVILGHPDVASVFATGLVMQQLPECEFVVMHSPALSKPQPEPLAELGRFDQLLCDELTQWGPQVGLMGAPQIVEQTGRAVVILSRPNSPGGLAMLRQAEPDLIVSIRYRRILQQQAIAIPKYGVINLHSGLLPDYRGVMATFWAMQAREQSFGCTLHYITDAGIDTGNVIAKHALPLHHAQSYLLNVLRLYPPGSQLIVAAIKAIAQHGAAPSTPQSAGGAYYSTPGAEDLQQFAAAGGRLWDGSERAWLQEHSNHQRLEEQRV